MRMHREMHAGAWKSLPTHRTECRICRAQCADDSRCLKRSNGKQEESSVTWACRQDLTAAKAAIEELFGKIREVRRKAEASEVMVQEICRDIRKLDFAKTHLTHTITALRRLAMLVNAVGEPGILRGRPLFHPAVLHYDAMPVIAVGKSMCSPLGHYLLSERHV